MSPAPPILSDAPPALSPGRSISYELTRWDLFANSMTVVLRNRLVQIILLIALLLNGVIVLAPQVGKSSPFEMLASIVVLVISLVAIVGFFQTLMSFAIAFLMKQNGVVGQHTLVITDSGLIERTEFNETLHKWPSVCRVMPLPGYVYIYVGDQNSHQVPRRCFAPAEIDSFMAELRARSPRLSR